MVFSSVIFLCFFLPITLFIYVIVRNELRNFVLLFMSLIFYAWGEPKFIILMLISIVFNYFFGLWVDYIKNNNIKKVVLIASVIFNLSFLIFFKYFTFIIDNLNVLFRYIGVKSMDSLEIALPIGISFYTFQAMSYVIDVYRKDTIVQKNILDLALYISLFPQLIAGPIVRYRDIALQIKNREITINHVAYGIKRFIIGLAKKVLIANTVATVADNIFSIPSEEMTFGLSWLGISCYTLQIYYDFSGYSDMAIGLGSILGFEFLENFNYPYIAKSIKEFWRRWHISLSTWFRDYLYIPLGGSRCSALRVYINLTTVFFVTGLWHGASWNFVIWGLFHGLFLILERTKFGKFIEYRSKFFKHIYTIIVVMVAWVFFRAETLAYAFKFIKVMFGLSKTKITVFEYYPEMYINRELLVAIFMGIIFSTPIIKEICKYKNTMTSNIKKANFLKWILGLGEVAVIMLIFFLCLISLASGTYNPFIYFRF